MDVQVFPILVPVIDFKNLLELAATYLNYSTTRKLDERRSNVKTFAGYLQILESIGNKDTDQVVVLRRITPLLDQISFSFLVTAKKDILEYICFYHNKIIRSSEKNFIIFHATLNELCQAINKGCIEFGIPEIRQMYNQIILLLEQAGLAELWHNYSKKQLKDGTFILE